MNATDKVIFFDTETGGLSADRHPLIQLSAAVVRWDTLDVLEEYERKIRFDESRCEAQALSLNSYSAMLWADARPQSEVIWEFADLCRKYACIEKVSKAGKTYRVAQLAAYNAAFDMDFLQHACREHKIFLPAEMQGWCVLQRAKWFFAENGHLLKPASFKLTDVCAALGVEHLNAHDACGDNYAQIGVVKRMRMFEGICNAT